MQYSKFLIVSILIVISLCSSKCNDEVETAYLFSYFTGNSRDGLHLAYSYDAISWTALNGGKSILAPAIGRDSLMRDPSITQGPDGRFYMVWTISWHDLGIGYASSDDLISWSEQQFLPVMDRFPSSKNVWAPELFYNNDDQKFYIVWASTVPDLFPEIETTPNEKGLNHRLFYTTTTDFKSFAPTEIFFDPGFSCIDGAFFRFDGKIFMVVKNEMSVPAEKNLRLTFGTDITALSTEVSPNISGNVWAEGPAPIVVGDTIIIYFDKYRNHSYGAIASTDCRTWNDISERINLPSGVRHGTIFAVNKSVVEKLKMKFQ